jgi:3'-phosphoadenosine 5'-phosphosulfate sulfotransferase (PAPS reductase)/FAD synthetase
MLKRRGKKLLVSCMGMRAQESPHRAKGFGEDAEDPIVFRKNVKQSIAGREWHEWLPIHSWKVEDVFETIREAGQRPHFAYELGNERLSCVFCILGSSNDARVGALYNPELFERYVEIEKRTGYTSHMDRRGLEQIAGLTVAEAYARRRHLPVVVG